MISLNSRRGWRILTAEVTATAPGNRPLTTQTGGPYLPSCEPRSRRGVANDWAGDSAGSAAGHVGPQGWRPGETRWPAAEMILNGHHSASQLSHVHRALPRAGYTGMHCHVRDCPHEHCRPWPVIVRLSRHRFASHQHRAAVPWVPLVGMRTPERSWARSWQGWIAARARSIGSVRSWAGSVSVTSPPRAAPKLRPPRPPRRRAGTGPGTPGSAHAARRGAAPARRPAGAAARTGSNAGRRTRRPPAARPASAPAPPR
jgi:hypothetical protein